MHGKEAPAPGQEDPGEDVGETLQDDDGFVLGQVGKQEDDDEDREIGVCPDRINIVVNLTFRHSCPVAVKRNIF